MSQKCWMKMDSQFEGIQTFEPKQLLVKHVVRKLHDLECDPV